MSRLEYDAILKKHPNLDSAYAEIPFDVEKVFGKKRIPIKAKIDKVIYRGTLVKMGMPDYWLLINQEIRKKTGKNPGDLVHIIIEEDREVREIEIPEDLERLLKKNTEAMEFFNTLSFSNRKEYVRWILDSKKEETRNDRLHKSIEKLLRKKKNPSEK